jgi:hypothetical protein
MQELVLEFAGGQVRGRGWDIVGLFTFLGTYDDQGSVRLIKQYLGAHRVQYEGTHDGEGTIFGNWFIDRHWSGPFALTPLRE